VTVTAKLTKYPTIATASTSFQLVVLPCIITSFTMNTIQDKVYGIALPLLSWNLVGNSITTQTPACDYSVNLVSSGEPSSFINVTSGTTLSYSAYTRDLTKEGDSNVTVTASLNGYQLGPNQTTLPSCFTNFTFSAVDPCLATQISTVPSGIENFAIFPGYPIESL
jgi:hypothetical protein